MSWQAKSAEYEFEEFCEYTPLFSEQQEQQLTIVSNPLLGFIDCMVSADDVIVERIRIAAKLERLGFDMYEVWRGQHRPVQGKTVAFTYHTLMRVLRDQRNAGTDDVLQRQLLAVLEHPYCCELVVLGYGICALISLSHYVAMDYPFVYWRILLIDEGWQPPKGSDAITRDMLAKALGVENLTDGQMKALRKLDASRRVSLAHMQQATELIAREWGFCQPLVAREAEICPMSLLSAAHLKSIQPELAQAKWFSLAQLQLFAKRYQYIWWMNDDGESEEGQDDAVIVETHDQIACVLYLWCNIVIHSTDEFDRWADIEDIRRNTAMLLHMPNIVAIENRAEERIRECMVSYMVHDNDPHHAGGFIYQVFESCVGSMGEKLRRDLHGFMRRTWRLFFEGVHSELLDRIYNDAWSENYKDDVPLQKIFRLTADHQFSRMETAGQLRAAADLLHNCAASRVRSGVKGDAEFWLYRNALTQEVALLQISQWNNADQFRVVEFNGPHNRGVTKTAQEHLNVWLLQQGQASYKPTFKAMCNE